jgi:RNA polymerase sigma-70 factor (ECF subfamily)
MDRLAEEFEAHRTRLHAVAHRMLGSPTEADDAVQEAWLRLHRADAAAVENLGGWLTTVVARIALDMLRSRSARREEPLVPEGPEPVAAGADPEDEALMADALGPALLVVLDTLPPAERTAVVLHDLFAVPFDEIAPIVGRTPAAARQLASRGRRRIQGVTPGGDPDLARRRAVVTAFLAASRGGSFDALLALLDPDVVLRSDQAAARSGSPAEVQGARDVAAVFAGRARAAQVALVGGEPALVWAQGGRPRVVFLFTVSDGRITAVEVVADPERLVALGPVVVG